MKAISDHKWSARISKQVTVLFNLQDFFLKFQNIEYSLAFKNLTDTTLLQATPTLKVIFES